MFWEWENEGEDINLRVDKRIREVFSLFHLMTVDYATLYLIEIFSGKHSSVSSPQKALTFLHASSPSSIHHISSEQLGERMKE